MAVCSVDSVGLPCSFHHIFIIHHKQQDTVERERTQGKGKGGVQAKQTGAEACLGGRRGQFSNTGTTDTIPYPLR